MLHALRPTTITVLQTLLALGPAAVGQTMAELAASLEMAERTIRRAFTELEAVGLLRCARRSDRRKCVAALTVVDEMRALAPRVVRPQSGPNRPKVAQTGPGKSAQSGPNRPKVAQSGPSPSLYTLTNLSGGGENQHRAITVGSGERLRPKPPPPPPQQLLGLGGDAATDRDRGDATDALRRLDHAVRHVWERKGAHHGFLLSTAETLEGLAIARRRYPWDEIVAVVRWSAERVAERKLAPAMFATTFRGAAFDCRYADWQRAQRYAAELAVATAHGEPEPDAPAQPGMTTDTIASVLAELTEGHCLAAGEAS